MVSSHHMFQWPLLFVRAYFVRPLHLCQPLAYLSSPSILTTVWKWSTQEGRAHPRASLAPGPFDRGLRGAEWGIHWRPHGGFQLRSASMEPTNIPCDRQCNNPAGKRSSPEGWLKLNGESEGGIKRVKRTIKRRQRERVNEGRERECKKRVKESEWGERESV